VKAQTSAVRRKGTGGKGVTAVDRKSRPETKGVWTLIIASMCCPAETGSVSSPPDRRWFSGGRVTRAFLGLGTRGGMCRRSMPDRPITVQPNSLTPSASPLMGGRQTH
jgi:hypothetical protein